MALNKERAQKVSVDGKTDEMRKQIEFLQRELQLVASPAARAAARESKESKDESASASKDMKKELVNANKQVCL